MSAAARAGSARPPYRFFRVRVARVTDLTPSFRRFTFTGDGLDEHADPRFDQRVKLVVPTAAAGLDAMPTGPDWYERWRAMDAEARPALRTYTTRAVRRAEREVDIDMVVHDVLGPASAWIDRAGVGDEVLIWAPTVRARGVNLGVDFVPPARVGRHLLVGDETAAPAIAAILEQLDPAARGVVVVEVPHDDDVAYLPRHPGFEYAVAARRAPGDRHGHLVPATRAAADALVPAGGAVAVEDVDVDHDVLWEVPRAARGGAALASTDLYAWLAGEAGAIRTLRRHLVAERGLDRRSVAFMGYWRTGRAEGA